MPVNHIIGRCLAGILCAAALVGATSAQANRVITVGAYHFPPVAEVDEDQRPQGLLGDLIRDLEAAHDDITFKIVHTSPRRRHLDFESGLYDVIFFESTHWGWANRDITVSRPILMDEDLYVALKKPDRTLDFFQNLEQRRLAGISGYHYGFADFETDPAALQEKFTIEYSETHGRNLDLIKADRPSVAEVAIVSRAYLQKHFGEHPEDRDRLLMSEHSDQRYQLRIIARKGAPLTANQLFQRMAPLVANGSYSELVGRWGLQLPPGMDRRADTP